MKQNLILSVFAIICFLVATTYILKHKMLVHKADDPVAEFLLGMQNPIDVKKIHVVSGNEFEIQLVDGSNIRAILNVEATPEARKHLLDLLNNSTNPRIIATNKRDNYWVVNLFVTSKNANNESVEVEVTKWLVDKKLTFRL